MSQFNADPDRSIKELLDAIERGARDTSEYKPNMIGAVLAPFAGLLVRLSRDSTANAKRLEELTKRLYWLTVVIAALTAVLVFREIVK